MIAAAPHALVVQQEESPVRRQRQRTQGGISIVRRHDLLPAPRGRLPRVEAGCPADEIGLVGAACGHRLRAAQVAQAGRQQFPGRARIPAAVDANAAVRAGDAGMKKDARRGRG